MLGEEHQDVLTCLERAHGKNVNVKNKSYRRRKAFAKIVFAKGILRSSVEDSVMHSIKPVYGHLTGDFPNVMGSSVLNRAREHGGSYNPLCSIERVPLQSFQFLPVLQ